MNAAKSTTMTGELTVPGPIGWTFGLFSPLGEKDWVPGWDPELLYPPGVSWEEGLVFRTIADEREAIWIVTRLDRNGHRVTYHKVEPARYVVRVEVCCEAPSPTKTRVKVAYTYVGLSEEGNRRIEAMTQAEYDSRMIQWQRWIGEYLKNRGG